MSGFALFFLQDPSLLEFQRRFHEKLQRNNLDTVFGVKDIPGDSQVRDIVDAHSCEPMHEVFREYFGSEKIHCEGCLRSQKKGVVRYFHHILQATDIEVNAGNVKDLVKGGQARWKIENEGFNTSSRAGFSSRKEFWSAIRATFRLLLFDTWEQVLQRMNLPPQPAFQG